MIETVKRIFGQTIGGCADVLSYCEDVAYGSTMQATCPATCGSCSEAEPSPSPTSEPTPSPTSAPCADDDARMIALASNAGLIVSGCADVQSFCEHAAYGRTVRG